MMSASSKRSAIGRIDFATPSRGWRLGVRLALSFGSIRAEAARRGPMWPSLRGVLQGPGSELALLARLAHAEGAGRIDDRHRHANGMARLIAQGAEELIADDDRDVPGTGNRGGDTGLAQPRLDQVLDLGRDDRGGAVAHVAFVIDLHRFLRQRFAALQRGGAVRDNALRDLDVLRDI
jgi:hypothetical protein